MGIERSFPKDSKMNRQMSVLLLLLFERIDRNLQRKRFTNDQQEFHLPLVYRA